MFLDAKRREQTVIMHKAGIKAFMLFEDTIPPDPYEAVLKVRELSQSLSEMERLWLFTYLELGTYTEIEKTISGITRQSASIEINKIINKWKKLK